MPPGAGGVLHAQPEVVGGELEELTQRRLDELDGVVEPEPEVRADVEDDRLGADRVGRLHRRPERRERVLAHGGISAGEVHEVEGVARHGLDSCLPATLAEARDLLRCMRRRPPHPRALREDLDRVSADLLDPVDRLGDASGGGDMGAEEHATRSTLLRSCRSAFAWRRRPPGSSTSAVCAPFSSTGSSRVARRASACCGSRTPTPAARWRSPSSRSSARCAGSASNGTVTRRSSSTSWSVRRPKRNGSSRRELRTRTTARSAFACPTTARPAGTTRSRAASRCRTRSSRTSCSCARTGGRRTTSPRRSRTGSTRSRTSSAATTTSRTRRSRSTSCARSAPSLLSTRTFRASSAQTGRSSRSATERCPSTSSGRMATSRRR